MTPVLLAMIAALSAEPAQTPQTLFGALAGSCWSGDLPGGVVDTHCFTVSDSGQLGLDVHKVRDPNGTVVYEGVTAYRPDAATGKVSFGYYNSLGDLMPGMASRNGDELDIHVEIQGKPTEVTWHLTADGYDVAGLQGPNHFRKVGPAPDGGL